MRGSDLGKVDLSGPLGCLSKLPFTAYSAVTNKTERTMVLKSEEKGLSSSEEASAPTKEPCRKKHTHVVKI